MSNAAHALPDRVRTIATAIANARGARRGVPEIADVLDALPMKLFEEVTAEAWSVDAALATLHAAAPPSPRKGVPLCEADADALRLDLAAGTLLILTRDHRGTARAALAAAAADTAVLGHGEAHALWRAIAAVLRTLPADPPPTAPDHPETAP